jgi:hypothetical protein
MIIEIEAALPQAEDSREESTLHLSQKNYRLRIATMFATVELKKI